MTWGAVAGAAVGLVGSAMSAGAAGDAADQQSASAAAATAAQERAAAQMRKDLSPWTSAGGAAQSALNQRLGLGLGTSGMVGGLQSGLTRDQVREQLLSQYTKSVAPGASGGDQPFQFKGFTINTTPGAASNGQYWDGSDLQPQTAQAPAGPTSQVDEAGLNAAIEKYYADQSAQEKAMASDPNYGSLLKQFTGADLENDPGYKFGLNQGQLGIDRAQASRGNFLSGAAIKEAARYGNDYAGTKFNEAFNRDSTNKNRVYSFLAGVSTLGQNSAAMVGTNNQQTANAAAGNALASGNAQSAATIAGGNALQSGINGIANAYRGASNNGLTGYDYSFNGQSNPNNQAALDAKINSLYQG